MNAQLLCNPGYGLRVWQVHPQPHNSFDGLCKNDAFGRVF